MRVVILQPSYLPWLGYFDQIRRADVFVFYDDVQYDKNGWRNRNRIKTPSGPQWLTVPVRTGGRFGQIIRETEIDGRQDWAGKHLRTLETNYRRAAHFDWCMAAITPVLTHPWQFLADLDIAMTETLSGMLGLGPRFVRSSSLNIDGEQTERLVSICRHFGATEYLSGGAAREYLDMEQFERAGIRVEFQEYEHPVYPQLHGPFVSQLSVVDLLMNVGPAARRYLGASVTVGACATLGAPSLAYSQGVGDRR